MKKLLFLLLLAATSVCSFSQPINDSVPVKTDYLQKSKSQKTVAWLFMGAGSALVLVGSYAVIASSGLDEPTTPGIIGIGIGIVSIAGSIPLFIASSRNKGKAMSLSFQNQFLPRLQQDKLAYLPVPSISLKINL